MAGNENKLVKYLVKNKKKIKLKHIGLIYSIGAPTTDKSKYVELNSNLDVEKYLSTEDSHKKADIYINGCGVSIKQKGSSFSYNRLQRTNIIELLSKLHINKPHVILSKIDKQIIRFHKGEILRSRKWNDFFVEDEFKKILMYLMMNGSLNIGVSDHQAEYVLEASIKNERNIHLNLYSFDEYFSTYQSKFKIALRRQWIGQKSNSEHKRSVGLAKKVENAAWVFKSIVGSPRTGWRAGLLTNRRTVYFLMIEKIS